VKFFFTDTYVLPLPEGHRFPMSKYRLLRQRLLDTGLAAEHEILLPPAATDDDLLRAHDADYLQRVQYGLLTEVEIRRIGFPWSPEMVIRSRRSSGATLEASRFALTEGVAANLAGGTHHAFRDAGEGFCVFNDAAIAARTMQAEGRVKRVVIIDCDVHQGNGTAAILRGDDTIFTFSIHGANNFPLRKEQSDLDVELPDGTEDAVYLDALAHGLEVALSHADADLAIYVSGADPYRDDRFGRLKLTKEGLSRRDELVFNRCKERGLPVTVTMAGGYSRDVNDTVDIHFETLRQARRILERWPEGTA
jgi:acetoin utilization deacetylase AcuC-like enzyme